jgi:hypothetical protein
MALVMSYLPRMIFVQLVRTHSLSQHVGERSKMVTILRYLALVPQAPSSALQELAFDCVRALHPLATPLSDTQIAQRRLTPLTPAQDAMLLQWGYPFVGDQFQWHMTLTGSLRKLTQREVRGLQDAARDWFSPVLNQPVELDAICWFVEPVAGGDFFEAQRFALGPA